MKKVLFTATVDSHILAFHLPYLKYFKENGYEVHVATNGNRKIPYCDKKIKISFERSPYKINNLKAIKQLKKVINNEKYDTIHTHTPMGSVVTRLAAKDARKKYNTRVIYTAHGFHFYKGAPKLNWLLFYPVERYLARYTDDLITINKEDYEIARSKFKTRVYYVPGVGVPEDKFDFEMPTKEKLELRKSLGLKKDDFVIIYVAELNKNKNQIFLINILKKIILTYPNIHLLLVGKGSYENYYKDIVKKQNLINNIHFLGFRNDIPKLLKISNLCASSSLREGLPVNIMESMHTGLPIIAVNARGVRDLIQNKKNGYIVQSTDIDDFKNKIELMYNDKKIYKRISDNNRREATKYSLSNIMKYIKKIYRL